MCDFFCRAKLQTSLYHITYIQKQLRPSWFSCGHLLGGPMYQNYNYYMHLGCQKVAPFPHLVRHWWSEEVWSLWRALRQRGHSLLLCSKRETQRTSSKGLNTNAWMSTLVKETKQSLATLDSWRTVVPSRAKWPTWPLFEGGALARLPDAVMLSTFYHWVLADDFKTCRRCLLESGNPGARSAFAYGSLVNFCRSGDECLEVKNHELFTDRKGCLPKRVVFVGQLSLFQMEVSPILLQFYPEIGSFSDKTMRPGSTTGKNFDSFSGNVDRCW